jgi:ubiquinone/menaquinone biosynthesis C-methylase UbiE
MWLVWFLALAGLALVTLFLYWQLVIAEGAYLGPRVVALLYDWTAGVYERIKKYDAADEQWFLGLPLTRALELIPAPLVLDVATGTGRLPRAVLRQPSFDGRVIGVDLSRGMLRQAAKRTAQFADRLTLVWQGAEVLPFLESTFDAVTCLEALEFTPDPRAVLKELARVLRPGGVLLVTNRVGPDARLLPGRAFPRPTFEGMLHQLPLQDVQVRPWQTDYDLAWAVKAGRPRGGGIRPLPQIMCCPLCAGELERGSEGFRCSGCGAVYRVAADGVIEMASIRAPRAGRTRGPGQQ